MGGRDDTNEQSNRRRFLKLSGASALAASIAGCNFDELTTKKFTANPYGIGGTGMQKLGFEERNHEKERSVAELGAKVVTTSHVTSYGHEARIPDETSWQATAGNSWSAGVLSTPEVRIGGEVQNPVAKQPLSKLLAGKQSDQFLSMTGINSSEWACEPTKVGAKETEMLGTKTEVEIHVGIAETDGRLSADAIYATRVIVDDEDSTAVLAGVVDRRSLADESSLRTCKEDVGEFVPDSDLSSFLDWLDGLREVFRTIGPLDEISAVEDLPPRPSFSLKDARLVQTSEDTEMTAGSPRPISDPPIDTAKEAAAVFNFTGTHLENLPSKGVWAEVSIKTQNRGTWTERFRIPKSDVEDIADGASPAAKFHDLARDGTSTTTPPVFDLSYDRATVKLIPDGSVTPSASTSWNVNTTSSKPLQVGFIHVKDPGSGHIDWGDSNGEAANYERSVNSSFAYLRRAFPGMAVAYRHDTAMDGAIRENKDDAVADDAWEARNTLNKAVQDSNFPNDGEIYAEDVTEARAEQLIGNHGLDVVVMILPRGTVSGNTDYYNAHGVPRKIGLFQGTKYAVGSLETLAGINDRGHAFTTAQECGHYFAAKPYDDGPNDPYSRTHTNNNGQVVDDVEHAHSDLESVGYSLVDGTFSLINDIEIRDGNFDPGKTQRRSGGWYRISPTHISFMSYASGNKWADNRITKFLIQSNFNNRYSGGKSPAVAPLASGAAGMASDGGDDDPPDEENGEVQPVFEALGRVVDGHPVLQRSRVVDGLPLDTEDVDTEHRLEDNSATPVEVTLQGPDGEELRSTVVPDRHELAHGHGFNDSFAVSLAFDDRGVWLRSVRKGTETQLNAVVHPLQNAVRRIPEHGFESGGESRSQLIDILDEVDAKMRERQYEEAAGQLDSEFISAVQEAVASYESLANEPTEQDVLSLTARMTERLEGL